jgi:hypothetical membrane protein
MLEELQKKMQKNHLFNSKTIIIKVMSLVVSVCHLRHPCCVMMCLHLVGIYGKMNYIYHNQTFCGSKQRKS